MTREMLSKVKNDKEALETQKTLFQSGNLETIGKTEEELYIELEKISKEIDNLDVEIKSIEQSLGLKRDDGVLEVEQELLKEAGELEKEVKNFQEKKELIEFPRKSEELKTILNEFFESVNLTKLIEKDEKGEKKNWGDTYIESFEKFKKKVLDTAPFSRVQEWERPSELEDFELLYDQKSYQEISRFVAGHSPKVFSGRSGNVQFNTLIQERPEFLKSKEVKQVYKYLLTEGIQNNTLFQGYHPIAPTRIVFPETKKDFIEENKIKWDDYEVGNEGQIDDFGRPIISGGVDAAIQQEIETGKMKRIRVPDSDKGFIVNLKEYQYNPDLLDSLDTEEKEQLQYEFIKEINKNIYSKYHSKEILADEIFRVGEKLMAKKSDIESSVFKAMKNGIINGFPPAYGIDKEFSNVYENIQGILQDPEKRADLINQIVNKVKEKDVQFSEWKDTENYLQLTENEKDQLIVSYLDMSQSESVGNKINEIFGYSWEDDKKLSFNKDQRLVAFSSMNVEQKIILLRGHFNDNHLDFKDFSRIAYLPFTEEDVLMFTNKTLGNRLDLDSDRIEEIQNAMVKFLQSSPSVIKDILKIYSVSQIPIENILEISSDNLQNFVVLADFLSEKFPLKSKIQKMLFERLRETQKEFWDGSIQSLENEKMKREQNIQSALGLENYENLPPLLQEKIKSFKENYGKKGEKLIALAAAAYGYEKSNENIFLNKLEEIEKILNLYHSENIPENCKVSMGIEYEVGKSIENNYGAGSYRGYVEDMTNISKAAGISRGNDAVWEIATKPTINPYLLIAEIKLLQDAGMLDFNFEKYTNAARGFHLSLGGESGLSAKSKDMNFLQNILTFSGYTGLLLGKEVGSVKGIHSKNLDSAGITNTGERVEFKGMGGDSFEQFEKTVITAHNVAIATQLEKKYGENSEFKNLQEALILTEYKKLKDEMVLAIKLHNESFIDMKFAGSFIDSQGNYQVTEILDRKTYLGSENVDLNEEQKKYIIRQDIFNPTTADSVNAITRANNLITFKKPVLPGDYYENNKLKPEWRGNSSDVLTRMKNENGDDLLGKPQDSIFERNGELRYGYYALQGTSTEMITHKVQILINNFNKAMNELINNPDPEMLASKKSLQYENV